ncbi:MAG: selenide, water dikinase SelD [Bdellovibrionales bacterium]|nr:selenide, water dikinase SelD [Bdellovibrionales bacterium]
MAETAFPPLTQTVKKGGCAAKLPAGQLRGFLGRLSEKFPHRPKELLVGTENLDDAALWDLGNGQLLIQTLDFFTPIVDSPKDFGAIAAANAISDVYAMGGKPATALTILAFPASTLPLEMVEPLMEGAQEVIAESGAVLAGGHSIDDETLKLGFSVSGFVSKDRAWTNAGAKPGDRLILTKGLGTGTITTALKNGDAPKEAIDAAIASMKKLNQAPELLSGITVHAATDITGFGLAGHSMQVAQASRVAIEFDWAKIPSLTWALDSIREENLNRAHKTNADYTAKGVDFSKCDPAYRWLALDPQTSGGLLLSVAEKDADEVVERLKSRFPQTAVIGKVVEKKADHWVAFI